MGLKFKDSVASKGGLKVGRIKDPLDKDYNLDIPPAFIPPFEASVGFKV